jgi:hypothetical protein
VIVGPQIVASTTDAGDIEKSKTVNSGAGLEPHETPNSSFLINDLSVQAPEAVSNAPIVTTLSTPLTNTTIPNPISSTSSKTERHKQPSEARVRSGAPASEASLPIDRMKALLKEAQRKYPPSPLHPLMKRKAPSTTTKHRTHPTWTRLEPHERVLQAHHVMAAASTDGAFHGTINLNLSYEIEAKAFATEDPTKFLYQRLKRYLGDLAVDFYIFVEDAPVANTNEIHRRAQLRLPPNLKRHIHGELSCPFSELPRVTEALCAAGGQKPNQPKIPHQLEMARKPNGAWIAYAAKGGRRYAVGSELRTLAEARYTEWRDHENKRRVKRANERKSSRSRS